MLPFLKNKQKSVGIVTKIERNSPSEEQNTYGQDLELCALDILRAIKTNDIKGLAEALKAAFEICDSQPHIEGEHLGE